MSEAERDVSSELRRLRERIQVLDAEVIERIAKRFRLVRTLGRCKHEAGLPIEDAQREANLEEIHRAVAEREGLDPAFVKQLFTVVLAESKDLQARSDGD